MGERKLATRMAFKPVAAARQEAIRTPLKAADEAMRLQTPGGVFSVRRLTSHGRQKKILRTVTHEAAA